VRDWIARLRAAFLGLAFRERLLVGSAGGLLGLALLYVVVVNPMLGAIARAGERRESAEQEAHVMLRLRREYDALEGRLASVEQRIRSSASGNLRSTLESLASQASVKVESMEPQPAAPGEAYRESKVEVTLERVNLAQTVNYLHQIEASPLVLSIKTLRIKKRPDNPELLDVSFSVSSFEPL
jgi:type II secretory pathway component PulM